MALEYHKKAMMASKTGKVFFMSENAKYWCGICYPENMIDNWRDEIDDLIQLPYAYCQHDRDHNIDGEERITHVHLMIAFRNTTTMKHVLSVCNLLSKPGKKCCSTVKKVIDIRHAYDYLIHDTEKSKKLGKYLYSPKDRICGNNFDIGAYEQISLEEKENILCELEDIIYREGFTNYFAFNRYVADNYDKEYRKIIRSHSGHFDRLIKGLWFEMSGKRAGI